ncbi:MAG: hypothetical protein QM725_14575 [Lacibacter sp.]
MKKWLTVTGFAAIALLYSFALSVNCFAVTAQEPFSNTSQKEQLSSSAESSFYVTANTRLTVSSAEKTAAAKSSAPAFYEASKTSAEPHTKHCGYLSVVRQLCVSFQKTVLLFPFHYFW